VTTVPGIDVSYWQAEIDWSSVSLTDRRFAFIKATEGLSYSDPTFAGNWKGAGDAGLLRGAYAFFHPNQDAKAQAKRFVEIVRSQNDPGELPCSVDLEVTDGLPSKKIISGVKTWLDEVEQALGRQPMIYSGVAFLEANFVENGTAPAWVQDYQLWLGWFPSQYRAGMSPLMPRGWSNWAFWQYSGKGVVKGIPAPVDLDFFNGTLEELLKLATAPKQEPMQVTYVAVAGDTFRSIASKYAVSVETLVNANPQVLRVGDRLTIPSAPQDPASPPVPAQTYIVKMGDTLYGIAKKFGTSAAKLAASNKISNPNMIQVGQTLIIA
jgi:lysozyme